MESKIDLRNVIVELHKNGKSNSQIVSDLKAANVTRKFVWMTIKRYNEIGSTQDRPRKGRPVTIRTADRIKRIREKVRRNPNRSMRSMAKLEGIHHKTMQKIVKSDLKLIIRKKVKVQVISEASMKKRKHRSKILLKKLADDTQPPVLWTDEKMFTIQQVFNHQNDRVICKKLKDVPYGRRAVFRRQKPASIMVWAGVTSDGKKTPLLFVPIGVKINRWTYLDILKNHVVPWVKSNYGENGEDNVTFQQDGAPSHTANIVQAFCKASFSEFWSKEMWPPSSPDLNVMDFAI